MLVAALLGCALVVGGAIGTSRAADAQARHVVVVGDSIMLGAKDRLADKYSQLGWTATLDMEVSRSTTAGLRAIESHRSELGDTLVIGLGANDAGNTDAFREKVLQVLNSVAEVPHVFWLTIAEARPYYQAANQVLRNAEAFHPNLQVIDWAAYAAATPTVAGPDGLHLTPTGAIEMANLVSFATVVASLPKASAPKTSSAPSARSAPAQTAPATTASKAKTSTTSTGPTTTARPRTQPQVTKEAAPSTRLSPRTEKGFSGLVVVAVVVALVSVVVGTWLAGKSRNRRTET